MLSNKIVFLSLFCILIVVIPAQTVSAEFEQARKLINLLPDSNLATNTNNLASNNFSTEYDILNSDVILPDGIFYGPYSESMLFKFDHAGGDVDISVRYNFTSQDILNGCSRFTVRIPILYDSAVYESIGLEISGLSNGPSSSVIDINDPYTRVGAYGVYREIPGLLLPGICYFNLSLSLYDDMQPSFFFNIEKYQLDTNTSFGFSKLGENESIWTGGTGLTLTPILYDFDESFHDIYLAYAFVFQDGMGQDGFYGVTYDYNTTEYYFEYDYFPASGGYTWMHGNNYSFYLPFRQRDSYLVDWRINISISLLPQEVGGPPFPYDLLQNPVDPNDQRHSIEFWVNDTEHFLLTSCPFWLNFTGTPDYFRIRLYPDREVTLLAQAGNSSIVYIGNYSYTPSFFIVHEFTTGQYAKVDPGKYYTSYDFGWGRGYRFPGDAKIFFFLNNNSNIFVEGNVELMHKAASGDDIGKELNPLFAIMEALYNIQGSIYGTIKFIWEGIQKVGEIVWSSLIGFVDWLLDIIGEIKDIVISLVTGFFYACPFLFILIALTYASGDEGKQELKKEFSEQKKNITDVIEKQEDKEKQMNSEYNQRVKTVRSDMRRGEY